MNNLVYLKEAFSLSSMLFDSVVSLDPWLLKDHSPPLRISYSKIDSIAA